MSDFYLNLEPTNISVANGRLPNTNDACSVGRSPPLTWLRIGTFPERSTGRTQRKTSAGLRHTR